MTEKIPPPKLWKEPSEFEEDLKYDLGSEGEGTPAEKREELKKVVEELIQKEQGVAEFSDTSAQEKMNVEHLEQMLAGRSAELDAEAAKLGRVEKGFRWWGETYNKLSTREKIGVGIALGLGAGGLAAVSVPAAFACLSGVALQRVAGLSSMFMKYEKSTQEGKWQKEKAMGKAIASQVAMTAGMLLLVEGAREGTEWLVHHWPGHEVPAVAPHEAVTPAPSTAPASFEVSVEAKAGHGYEWMVKRLWEQLQDKNLDPSKFGADTDIHKLLTADADSIDTIVHQIAADPQHGFFNADGTSVQINATDHLSIGADGDIHLGDAEYGNGFPVHAPEGAPVTPVYHPEASATQIPEAPTPAPTFDSGIPQSVESFTPPAAETPAAETPVPPAEGVPVTYVTNPAGLQIEIYQPHIYSDTGGEHLFVFGGSPEEKANTILEYLTKNPDKIIYSADANGEHRIPWHLIEGKAVPEAPVQTEGFLGFFKSFMQAPGPEEFEKLIK